MVNKVILIGRLTKDLEKKYVNNKKTNEQIAKINFNVAINRGKDKQGNNLEPEIIPCTAFEKLAENIFKYLEKGSQIYIEGTLNFNRYTDEFNNKKTFANVVVRNVSFLGDSEEVRRRKEFEKQNNISSQNKNVVIDKLNVNKQDEKQVINHDKKQEIVHGYDEDDMPF